MKSNALTGEELSEGPPLGDPRKLMPIWLFGVGTRVEVPVSKRETQVGTIASYDMNAGGLFFDHVYEGKQYHDFLGFNVKARRAA